MFVYIWKDSSNTPFYVGLTKSAGRTNPRNNGNRNWLCKSKIEEIGVENIIVEIRHVENYEEGKALEISLINSIGRIQLGTGPLTNLRDGGSGTETMSPEARLKLSKALSDPNHPIRSKEAREKHKKRMQDPDVKILFSGENNPAKKPEVREKIKAKWQDPDFRAARIKEKIGKPKHSEETKEILRQRLLDPSHPMRGYHKILNTDPAIKAKREAALRTPESREKRSIAMKKIWAKRKGLE
jgi:hypothetical protein